MKTYTTLLLLTLAGCVAQVSVAQSVQLSYPIDYSVLQRSGSDQAAVTIAGQVTGGSSTVGGYQLYYRTSVLDASGNATSTTGWSSLGMQSNGSYYTTPVFSKGWYRLEMGIYNSFGGNIAVAASVKFGVGDVFMVAGQSNAQGVNDDDVPWGLPQTSGFPEWIVGVNAHWSCEQLLPNLPVFSTISGFNKVGPGGNNSWCYAVLGKKISDANGGMPIAFFNSAYGGSVILNWANSSTNTPSNQPFTNAQTCFRQDGSNTNGSGQPIDNLGRTSDYFNGMPYLTLKNTLNLHGSLFGTRALLWHQGETDADPTRNPIDRTTNTQDYKDRLQQVISKTRSDFNGSLSWMVARSTYISGGNITQSIRDAQLEKSQESDKNEGPDTDYQPNSQLETGLYRSDGTHFNENANSGLTYLGNQEWADKVNNSPDPTPAGFSRIAANPVPQLFVSKNGSSRTVSVNAVSGAQQYRWGMDINNPVQQGTNLTSITVPTGSNALRCFIRDATGNWRISPRVDFGCPSCRQGIEESTNEDPWGLALTVYPNPFAKELTVEFNVPQPGSDVRLELIDVEGRIIRTIASGIHDKGHWKYPVTNLNVTTNTLYFCRLKVGDLFTTRKLLPVD